MQTEKVIIRNQHTTSGLIYSKKVCRYGLMCKYIWYILVLWWIWTKNQEVKVRFNLIMWTTKELQSYLCTVLVLPQCRAAWWCGDIIYASVYSASRRCEWWSLWKAYDGATKALKNKEWKWKWDWPRRRTRSLWVHRTTISRTPPLSCSSSWQTNIAAVNQFTPRKVKNKGSKTLTGLVSRAL